MSKGISNEVIFYENYLNSHSKKNRWRYINWENLEPMFRTKKEGENPLCLIAFESMHGGGIDPYSGLPYKKHLYYIQEDCQSVDPNIFMSSTGQSLIDVIKKNSQSPVSFPNAMPQMTYPKTLKTFEIYMEPPIESAKIAINFACSISPKDSLMQNLEVEVSRKGFSKLKANNAYNSIFSNFSLDLNSLGSESFNLGVKNSILVGNGFGEFTTKANIMLEPSPGIMYGAAPFHVKLTSSGEYAGKDQIMVNGEHYEIQYTLSYDVEVTLNKSFLDKLKVHEHVSVPLEKHVRVLNNQMNDSLGDRGLIGTQPGLLNDERIKKGIMVGVLVGSIIVFGSSVLEVISGGVATPAVIPLTVMGVNMMRLATR